MNHHAHHSQSYNENLFPSYRRPASESDPSGRGGSDLSTLRRGIEILQLLQQHTHLAARGLGNNRIAELLDADKSQVSRTLRALTETGLVERDEVSKTYRLGPGAYALGMRAADQSLLRIGSVAVRHAVRLLGCRVFISVRQGTGVMTLWSDQPAELQPVIDSMGMVYPLAGTETGRALLYTHRPSEIHDILDDGTRDRALVEEFIRHVAADRKKGFSFGKIIDGPGGSLAVPVWTSGRRIMAALGASLPSAEDPNQIAQAARVLLSTAAEITRRQTERRNLEMSVYSVPYQGWPKLPDMTGS